MTKAARKRLTDFYLSGRKADYRKQEVINSSNPDLQLTTNSYSAAAL